MRWAGSGAALSASAIIAEERFHRPASRTGPLFSSRPLLRLRRLCLGHHRTFTPVWLALTTGLDRTYRGLAISNLQLLLAQRQRAGDFQVGNSLRELGWPQQDA